MSIDTHMPKPARKWLLAVVFFFASAAPALANCVNMFGVPGACASGGILSSISCNFMMTMYQILSIAYCSILVAVAPALAAALLLYVVIFGLLVSVGAMQLSAKEVTVRLLKIALIWLFATQASYVIGFAYNGLIGFVNDATLWVLGAALGLPPNNGSINSVFALIDAKIYERLIFPLTAQGAVLMGFFITLSYALPPIFLLFMYLLIKTIAIFVRAIISYLLGISAITFLIALAPIFVSFALFKVTTQFFESWLRYIASFALQIVLVFAAISMWVLMVGYIEVFFMDVGSALVQFKKTVLVPPNSTEFNVVAVCQHQIVNTVAGMKINCVNADALPPSSYPLNPDFMYYLVVKIVTLVMLAYAFDTLLKQIPNLARQLSGPKYVPMLAGTAPYAAGSIMYPGAKAFSAIGGNAADAFNNETGNLFSKIGSGLKEAARESGNQLGFRDPNTKALGREKPVDNVREQQANLVKDR